MFSFVYSTLSFFILWSKLGVSFYVDECFI